MLPQVLRQLLDSHPVHPRTPLVRLDSRQRPLAVFPLADSFHPPSVHRRVFGPAFRRERFGPFPGRSRSFTPTLVHEGQLQLDLLPLTAHESRRLLATTSVRAFVRRRTTMPSADFCRPIKAACSTPSPVSRTHDRSPEVSSTTFRAQPPNLQPASLMDMDFAILGPLVRRRMPAIRFLSIGSRFCSTLPSDPASRRRPCASLELHLHQVVQGTSTPKLSNMLGTPHKRPCTTGARRHGIAVRHVSRC